MADLLTDLRELFLQAHDFGLALLGADAQILEFSVDQATVQGHAAGRLHGLLQHRGDFFERRCLTDLRRATLQGFVINVAGHSHLGQAFDEACKQGLHLLLRLEAAPMRLRLLDDDVLEAALYAVEPAQSDRRRSGGFQGLGLPLQPEIIGAEHRDVFEHHVQQFKQTLPNGRLLFGGKRQAVAEVAKHLLRRGNRGPG